MSDLAERIDDAFITWLMRQRVVTLARMEWDSLCRIPGIWDLLRYAHDETDPLVRGRMCGVTIRVAS